MAKVYLETSFFSACVSTRTGAKNVGWKASSLEWWHKERKKHELFISAEVIRELSSPAFKNREAALAMIREPSVIVIADATYQLAQHLVEEKVMPGPAVEGDAIHVALSILNRIEYILSWNVKHLANPAKITHLGVICLKLGMAPPRIVTPDMLVGD